MTAAEHAAVWRTIESEAAARSGGLNPNLITLSNMADIIAKAYEQASHEERGK